MRQLRHFMIVACLALTFAVIQGCEVGDIKDLADKYTGDPAENNTTKPVSGEVLPWGTWDQLTWVGMPDVSNLPVVMELGNVNMGRSQVSWEVHRWPDSWNSDFGGIGGNVDAVMVLAFKHDGRWYALCTEWLRVKRREAVQAAGEPFRSVRHNGKHIWSDPFREHTIPPGTECAMWVLNNWQGKTGTPTQRSSVSAVFTR